MREMSLPEHWKTEKLGQLCRVFSGYAFKTSDYTKKGIPLIKIGNLQDGEVVINPNNDCVLESWQQKEELQRFILKSGDILIALTGTTGKTAVVAPSLAGTFLNQRVGKIELISPDAEQGFILVVIKTRFFQEAIQQNTLRSTQGNISPSSIAQIPIPLPPLPEQRRIAAILDKADVVRRKRREAIQLTEEFLRSAFLEMFGDPVTNPKGWEVKRVDEIGIVQGGLQLHARRSSYPTEVPYLRVANVYRDRLELAEIKTIRVTEAELKRVALDQGDLLIVEGHGNRKEIGRSAVWDGSIEPCLHQNHLIRVSVNKQVAEPKFVSAYLNSPGGRRQLFRFGKTTSGLNTISTSNVKATQVLLPPLPLQKQYLTLAKQLEQARNRLQKNTEQQDNLFNALVQRAFRGEL